MGEVYRAHDARLGRAVAVKVLPPFFATDADRLQRFEREARSVAALSHPNILAVHDIGTHDGTPYMVTELLEGETLRERLQGGSISNRKAIEIAIQIAHGLAAAYDKGIIHRDLKPENIFLTRDGRVKILDFGLAKAAPLKSEASSSVQTLTSANISLTEGGQVLGTAGYMSPEQVRGMAVDHRSDIFVFGAILFEMLSGQRAFRRDTAAETMTAILKEDLPEIVELDRSIPPALDRIVRHCLEKDPDQRFQSARDLAFDLEALSGASSTAQAKAGQPTTVQRVRRFQPVIIIVLVALAAALGYTLARDGKTTSQLTYHQLTFRKGTVLTARFAPDNRTVLYSAAWGGQPSELFSTHLDSIESRPLGLHDATLLGVSSQGELAVSLKPTEQPGLMSVQGTLARTTLTGGSAPREILESVEWSDWSPDGSSLLVVRTVDNENRIEYPVGKVIYKTALPNWVSHPRISRDGKRIAFCQHAARGDDRGSLTLMNADGSDPKPFGNFDGIQGLAWSPKDDEVWFTANVHAATLERRLMAVTLSGSGKSRLLADAPGELTLHDVSPDGTAIVSIENRERKIFFSGSEPKGDRDLTWLDRAVLGALSLDGKQVLFWEGGKGGGPLSTIFLRNTDGSPAVRLGEGYGIFLSPDQKLVLAVTPGNAPRYSLIPAGAGETTELKLPGIEHPIGTGFTADSRRILFNGNEPGHKVQAYALDPASGKIEPLTSEGVRGFPSPDGKFLVELSDGGRAQILTLGSNQPAREIKGREDQDIGIQVAPDGNAVFVVDYIGISANVYRIEIATGRRELVKKIEMGDPAGAVGITTVRVTPDGKNFAYNTLRQLSELYLLQGLK
jgi:serine/threonine protein kinase